ncbi:hypothetical protein MAHJHV33_48490 [Mycobacterium avium subsp. hominissuis]
MSGWRNRCPAKLAAAGHRFRHPDIERALRHLLGRGELGRGHPLTRAREFAGALTAQQQPRPNR